MATCVNCGSFVTDSYERVFARDEKGVRCCPHCELIRDDEGARQPRNKDL